MIRLLGAQHKQNGLLTNKKPIKMNVMILKDLLIFILI